MSAHIASSKRKRALSWSDSSTSPKRTRRAPFAKRLEALRTEITYRRNSTTILLRLPRELRDDIYDYVWGNRRIEFRHRKLTMFALRDGLRRAINGHRRGQNKPPRSLYTNKSVHGLPSWITASKQVLHEAMEVFGATRIFAVISEDWDDDLLLPWGRMRTKNKNTLFMSSIKHFVLVPQTSIYCGFSSKRIVEVHDEGLYERTVKILRKLEARPNITLLMDWCNVGTFANFEIQIGEGVEELFFGICTKVLIVARAKQKGIHANGFLKMVDAARAFAKRIVRGDEKTKNASENFKISEAISSPKRSRMMRVVEISKA